MEHASLARHLVLLTFIAFTGCKCDGTNSPGADGSTPADAAGDGGDQGGDASNFNPDDSGVGATDAGSTVRVVGGDGDGGCFPGTNCAGGADGGSADGGPVTSCTSPMATPTLVYPPDQVLVPPNMGILEVQFKPGTGNKLFEIDFQNARTDVRIITKCTAVTNTRGGATGGCAYSLDFPTWQAIAQQNRGTDAVHVSVRATDGNCVSGSNTRDMLFAKEDLIGAIYYWQSVVIGGVPGKAGGIYRYDFGDPTTKPEAYISAPGSNNRCVGCHFLSRDGQRITFGNDDADSDDEFGDVHSALQNIATGATIVDRSIPPGFRAFSKDHTKMIATDGDLNAFAASGPPEFGIYNGDTGALGSYRPTTGGARGTHPDWAPDDSSLVFVRPTKFLANDGSAVNNDGTVQDPPGDDMHFIGGSLYTMKWNGTTFGTPTALLTSTGENNFYPAFSPDGRYLVFNRVIGPADLAADAFSNPAAKVWAMPAAGGTPVELARANQGDGVGNSWPRFSPYIQNDRGHTIAWITFSSTRDYGLRVQNADPNGYYCYPPDSPQRPPPNNSHQCALLPPACSCGDPSPPPSCTQQFCVSPQLWMAAVEIDASGAIVQGKDPSHPAFWLPFQEVSAHNHIAQWVARLPDKPVMDGGVGTDCSKSGATCGEGFAPCCNQYTCNSTSVCQPTSCSMNGEPCVIAQDCCGGLSCLGHVCTAF